MDFHVTTNIPLTLKPGAIERAVHQFVEDTEDPKIPLNKDGLYNQLITYIGNTLIARVQPHAQIWIKEDEDGEVGAFAITNFDIEVDNSLTLWLSVAWVRKQHRFTSKPKEWFHQLEEFGKASGAKHLLIPSVRGVKGYLRFVGRNNWHQYHVILKRDL